VVSAAAEEFVIEANAFAPFSLEIMTEPTIKAFVLCDEITESACGTGQKDLQGAGLKVVRAAAAFPIKHSFWVYIELADQKPMGNIQLALMRADSGRRLRFRVIPTAFADPLLTTVAAIHVFECVFPATGVYFVELWYDGKWLLDQRLEVV
jgi:hypothetical protein